MLFGNAEYSDPDRDSERSELRSYRVWVRTIRNAKRGRVSVSCDYGMDFTNRLCLDLLQRPPKERPVNQTAIVS